MFVIEDGRNVAFTFFLLVFLFALWGFCNGMIDVMDKHFQDQLHLSGAQIQLFGSIQSVGSAIFAILLGRWAATRNPGSTMAKELMLVAGGTLGIVLAGSPLLVIPMVFLLGGARASSYVSYSLLSNMRHGRSRAGQFGFYLTFEQLGFVGGAFIGGFLYAINHASNLITTSVLFILLALLAGFRIKRVTRGSQVA